MKRVFFVVTAMLLGATAMAQTEKGSKVLGGDLRIGGNEYKNSQE